MMIDLRRFVHHERDELKHVLRVGPWRVATNGMVIVAVSAEAERGASSLGTEDDVDADANVAKKIVGVHSAEATFAVPLRTLRAWALEVDDDGLRIEEDCDEHGCECSGHYSIGRPDYQYFHFGPKRKVVDRRLFRSVLYQFKSDDMALVATSDDLDPVVVHMNGAWVAVMPCRPHTTAGDEPFTLLRAIAQETP